jgi:type IV pilus assembly protein PilE
MNGQRASRRAISGFSMIELLVVMIIVGILASIAVASYRSNVMQANRTDAIRAMTSWRQSLERCYSQSYTYVGCSAIPGTLPTPSPSAYYLISFPTLAASSYKIVATPTGRQVNDTTCASFQVTNTGAQAAQTSGGVDSTRTCWGSN